MLHVAARGFRRAATCELLAGTWAAEDSFEPDHLEVTRTDDHALDSLPSERALR